MKKIIQNKNPVVVLLLFMMLLIPSGLSAASQVTTPMFTHDCPGVTCSQTDETITVSLPIGMYQILESESGTEVSVENFGQLCIPGAPSLPSKIFAVAIPPDCSIVNVNVDAGVGVSLPGTYHLTPSPLPRVIGEEDSLIAASEQQQYTMNYDSIYSQNTGYPSQVGEYIQTAYYRNYILADVSITPFTYYPVSGQLVYYPEVTIQVQYTAQENSNIPLVDNQLATENTARDIIINYDQAKEWYTTQSPLRDDVYDFVIITLDSLTSSVTPLVEWETEKGRSVEVVTTTWINSNYAGYDLAEKMRNFLREKYPESEWGIQNVLLVGSYNDVPIRRTWQDLGYGKPETDYYFAELSLPDNQSWDKNGNHRYGEPADPIDFYTEVNVGRIPWSEPETVLHICEKSVAYEQNNDPSFKKNILLLGGYFWNNDPNPMTDNAVLMEAKVDQTWMSDWTITRMYEKNTECWSSYPCNYPLMHSNVMSVWPTGSYGFVNWAGHGSPVSSHIYGLGAPAFIESNDCDSLNDEYPAIIFADACSNSDTDEVNIGQSMLRQGAVGFVGATKVALGCPGWSGPYDGSSQSLDYFFTTAVTSGEYTQGAALQWALRQMYTNNLWGYARYEMFEWGSLWGNPDLGMAVSGPYVPPGTPSQPTGPSEGIVNDNYSFCVTIPEDPDGDVIFLRWDWGDGSYSGWLGPYAEGEVISITHSWGLPGIYAVRVKAEDVNGSQSSWSEPLLITIVKPPQVEIVSVSGGFGVRAVVRNIIDSELTDIPWNISLHGGFLLMRNGTSGVLSSLVAGEEKTIISGLVLGFGRVTIVVTADDQTVTVTGFLFGPFLFGVK